MSTFILKLIYRSFCIGEVKGTNDVRRLISNFLKGSIPASWFSQYSISKSLNVNAWIANLAERCKSVSNYKDIIMQTSVSVHQYWLGGMFSPEAFVTASRQATAQVFI